MQNAHQAPYPRIHNEARRAWVHHRDVEEEFDLFVRMVSKRRKLGDMGVMLGDFKGVEEIGIGKIVILRV